MLPPAILTSKGKVATKNGWNFPFRRVLFTPSLTNTGPVLVTQTTVTVCVLFCSHATTAT